MIKYRLINSPFSGKIWHQVPGWWSIKAEDFSIVNLKINDVIYTKWDNKLESAIIWDRLRNGEEGHD